MIFHWTSETVSTRSNQRTLRTFVSQENGSLSWTEGTRKHSGQPWYFQGEKQGGSESLWNRAQSHPAEVRFCDVTLHTVLGPCSLLPSVHWTVQITLLLLQSRNHVHCRKMQKAEKQTKIHHVPTSHRSPLLALQPRPYGCFFTHSHIRIVQPNWDHTGHMIHQCAFSNYHHVSTSGKFHLIPRPHLNFSNFRRKVFRNRSVQTSNHSTSPQPSHCIWFLNPLTIV